MLQGGARMITQGGAPHPQAMGPPGGAQFQTQGENPQVQQQGLYGMYPPLTHTHTHAHRHTFTPTTWHIRLLSHPTSSPFVPHNK